MSWPCVYTASLIHYRLTQITNNASWYVYIINVHSWGGLTIECNGVYGVSRHGFDALGKRLVSTAVVEILRVPGGVVPRGVLVGFPEAARPGVLPPTN